MPPARCSTQEALEERRLLHRRVAHRDEHDALGVRERRQTDADGVRGALLRLLAHRRGAIGHGRLDRVRPVAGHDHRTLNANAGEGVEHVEDEWAAGKRVQHLRDAGSHAGTLPRGQDDGRGCGQVD